MDRARRAESIAGIWSGDIQLIDAGRLTISFGQGDSADPACRSLPERFYRQFTEPAPNHPDRGRYERGCSIVVTPPTFAEYWLTPHSYWLRQRVRRAQREGYRFEIIDRNDYLDDIFAINTSMTSRQGKPMAEAYRVPPRAVHLPDYACPRHALLSFGIVREDRLLAYAWVYQVGEMCLFSTILGHGDHLKAGIMPLLVSEAIRHQMETAGLRYGMYNLHASGTTGLRFFKEQVGFRAYDVTWHLGPTGLEVVPQTGVARVTTH